MENIQANKDFHKNSNKVVLVKVSGFPAKDCQLLLHRTSFQDEQDEHKMVCLHHEKAFHSKNRDHTGKAKGWVLRGQFTIFIYRHLKGKESVSLRSLAL